jgi:hypothetical protein
VAPLASPAFTGVPTAPTAAVGTNTDQIATMAALWNQTRGIGIGLQGTARQTFNSVSDLIANTVSGGCYFADGSIFPIGDGFYYLTRVASRDSGNGSSSFLAIGDYSGKSYIGTIAIDGVTLTWTQLTTNDSPSFTGVPTAPTATAGTNTTQLATTQFVTSAVAAVSINLNNPIATFTKLSGNNQTLTLTTSFTAPVPGVIIAVGNTNYAISSGTNQSSITFDSVSQDNSTTSLTVLIFSA